MYIILLRLLPFSELVGIVSGVIVGFLVSLIVVVAVIILVIYKLCKKNGIET